MERDPRIDPQPGDRVRGCGIDLYVLARVGGNVTIEEIGTQWHTIGHGVVPVRWWRSWCRRNRAEVVKEET